MRFRSKMLSGVVLLAVVLLATPLWAKSLKATVTIDPAQVAGHQIKAGSYDFVVNGNHLQIKNDNTGKVVAQVAGQLMQSKNKPQSDEIILVRHHIREVHFANKTAYFKVKG